MKSKVILLTFAIQFLLGRVLEKSKQDIAKK
jgi:hypothetical protein